VPAIIFSLLFVTLFPYISDNRYMEAQVSVLAGEEAEPLMQEIDFATWMAEEQARIFSLCMRLLRNQDEADSATQDVFVEAYKTLEKHGRGSILEPPKWLTRVAFNTCYDLMRSKRWRFWQRHAMESCGDDRLPMIPATGPNQEDAAAAQEIRRRLDKALDRLSVRQKTVFIFRHEEQLRFDEIAGIMGLDTGTVKAHMARAIKKLREELRDMYVR
jgi:RNA polymerase sigma-70 factor, ECF subfamily